MAIFDHLALGLSIGLFPLNLAYCFLGVLLGTLIGVLPGIGPAATLAMLLPLTIGLPPTTALIALAGIYYGSQYGGSTTAILVNMPGESSSVVTTLDGYQMAQQGRAGPALAAAAIGSFFAGTIATLLIALVAGPLTRFALSFGSAEYFALLLLGLISSVALASGSVLKAIGMICLGVLFGMVGTDLYSGMPRYTLGLPELYDGIDFVAVAVGMFGISEILRNLERSDARHVTQARLSGLMPTREDFRRMVAPMLRGTTIGSILGVLPGGGAILSSFVAYAIERRVSPRRAEFGKGAIEGVTAPESANNAGAQTSFIPMLSLGIPSNGIMALMIGAMIMQGIVPGPSIVQKQPELFWGLIASMWIGNAMLLVLNLPLVGFWVKLLQIPYRVLFPAIIAFCCVGAYSSSNSVFPVLLVAIFGVASYFLSKLECEATPFVLGFVLGPMLEDHFRRAMIISHGDFLTFFQRPFSAVLMAVALIFLVGSTLPAVMRKRSDVFDED